MGEDKVKVKRLGRRGRMTVKRKREAVIRVLRGEDLDLISPDPEIKAAKINAQNLIGLLMS